MKKIILHDQRYTIGGPSAVLNGIEEHLSSRYNFVRLYQKESCGFNPFKAARFIYKYKKLIDSFKADAIYICGLQYTGFLLTIAAKISNVKTIILSVHGSDWDNPNTSIRKWILMHIIEPIEIALANTVFTVCERAQKTIKPLKYSRNNCGVVYNAFPNINFDSVLSGTLRKELNIPDEKIVVTTVGRVVEAKGHSYIIDAIEDLTDTDFVFVIVGDGTYIDAYKQKCGRAISEKRLFLLGIRKDIPEILKDSDIFLFPTFNENHSIAMLEAVNMKCPIIATDVGGNKEIIEQGTSGLLIQPRSHTSILNALFLLKDEETRKRLADNAYVACKEKFSFKNTYGKLDSILNNKTP